jgi:phosphatidylglycerophosphatase A
VLNKIAKLLATFFYIGDIPVAPGSAASVAGTLMYVALYPPQWGAYLLLIAVITMVGLLVSGRTEKFLGQEDPSCIVIDEVAGVLIAFFMLPLTWPVILTTFFLFRAFDMFKIYPVNKFEEYGGSLGIMMDDLFAGFYTNIIMQIAVRWAGVV